MSASRRSSRRGIPAVDSVLAAVGDIEMPRPVAVAVIRRELSTIRRGKEIPDTESIIDRVRQALAALADARIRPVINGTGTVIHTNLGRAPLGKRPLEALAGAGGSYSNLEISLKSGKRSGRAEYLEHNLAVLCGSDAATMVNNCAAALVLILKHYCTEARPEVVISRGELIQIGGGFRIPEILEASGATLREIGTTNRTTVQDYTRALGPATALILRVHRSNFFMEGFVDSPSLQEIVTAARKKRVPVVEDLGSGAVLPTDRTLGIEHEPMPAESLKAGVDLVCFSGDKLMGGAQAGVIAGKRRVVAGLKKNPLYRALRCDKLAMVAMQECVDAYLEASDPAVPVIDLLRQPVEELRSRAEAIAQALADSTVSASVCDLESRVGGGTLPRVRVTSAGLALRSDSLSAPELSTRLRAGSPPVIPTVAGGAVRIDLRTVFACQDEDLIEAIRCAAGEI